MDFAVLASRGTADDVVEKAIAAERHGFDCFGVGDTQSVFRECHTLLGAVASATETIDVGPMVTNPVTRHPAVTASAMCTLDDLSDGRATMGLGSGDSAVRTIGERPATLDDLESFATAFRALAAGRESGFGGETVRLEWVTSADPPSVPIVLSAGGPKTQRLAGRVADVVLVASGLTEPVLSDAVDRVAAGARDAGRDPGDVDVWAWAKTNIAPSRERSVDEIKTQLASTANHLFRYSMADKNVPERYRGRIRDLQDAYDPQRHLGLDEANPNRELVERFGLTDYLADRFAVAGPPERCVDSLTQVCSIDGVDGVFFTVDTPDQLGHIRTLGEDVLPRVSDAVESGRRN